MIKRISVKNCATFDSAGSLIEDCKQINFIYGANGSGKSTISNLLKNPIDSQYINSHVEWDIEGRNDVLVYNRKFREENFKTDKIAGVFTLGKNSIDQKEEIENLKDELKNEKSKCSGYELSLQSKNEELNALDELYKEKIWTIIYKKYEKYFKEAFKGFGTKEKFKELIIEKYKEGFDESIKYDELIKKAEVLYGERPISCSLIEDNLIKQCQNIIALEEYELLNECIIGSSDVPIAKLINTLNISSWVKKGKEYIDDSSICPFCQQSTISEDLREQLESFFNEEYETKLSALKLFQQDYNEYCNKVIFMVKELKKNERIISIGEIDLEKFTVLINLLENIFANNLMLIENKIHNPEIKTQLNSMKDTLNQCILVIEMANKQITQHNYLVENYQNSRNQLNNDVIKYCVTNHKELLKDYLIRKKSLTTAIDALKGKIESSNKIVIDKNRELIEKQKNMTSVQPTVDEINNLLKTFNFNSFSLIPLESENSYQIIRNDGSLVQNTLSEGEETFITFLYFMQLTKGAIDVNNVSNKKVVVLDDPICSLDSSVLFVVGAMVKELIESVENNKGDVEQVFVLTHNVFFHKEISHINGRTATKKTRKFWIVYKNDNVSKIKAYGMENPIKTNYELLWSEIREGTATSLVSIQNVMRRIIENYFSIIGTANDIEKRIFYGMNHEEQIITKSLLYWINDGSHSINDDFEISLSVDVIEKYKKVFEKIFYQMGHEAHYKMMMKIE